MSIKDFKKGIEAGAKPFEDKFKQHAEAITRVSDKLEAGMDKVTGVVEAVIDDMSVIEKKRLYDLNTQYDLQSLEDYEKELLVAGLFTLAKGTANENQQSYVRSVTKYLGIKNPQTEVDLSGIENIESLGSQKAMFQTFAEFIFLEKEDVAVLTEYEDLFDLFSVKKKDCLAIFDNILKLYKVVGAKGLSEKFGFTVNAKGIKAPVVVDILNVMLIDKPLDIAAGEEKVFTAQKIRLIAPIICNGKLTLQSCVIVYNSASIGDGFIGGDEGSAITMSDCTFIDQNDEQWDKDEAAEAASEVTSLDFANADSISDSLFRGSENAKLICSNSFFYNCRRFSFGFATRIDNCIIRFNDIPTDMSAQDDDTYSLASSVFTTIPGNGSVVNNCLIENTNESLVAGLVSEKDSPSSSNFRPYENTSILFRGFDSFIGCSFKNLIGCVQLFTKIDMCNFVNCLYALLGDLSDYVLRYKGLDEEKREVEVANSIFEDCRDVINFVTSVTNCQFIGSNEEIIGSFDRSDGYNALSIEKCSFYNSRTKEKPIIEFKNKANHCLADCVFDGIDASELYKSLIDVGPSGGHLTVSSCTFANCATSDGNEIIKTEGGYYTGAFKKKYVPVELSEIKNCHGLENVNDGKNKVKDPPIQHKTKKGIEIGASIENEDVGVPGFDPTTA